MTQLFLCDQGHRWKLPADLQILGAVLAAQRKFIDAEPVLEEAVTLRRKTASVGDTHWLSVTMELAVYVLMENGKVYRAADVLRENLPTLARLAKPSIQDHWNLARWQAWLSGLIDEGARPLTAQEEKEYQETAGAATESLRAAVAAGFRDAGLLRRAPELTPIRQRADFQALVQELEKSNKD